jgi:zinc D-Ala-D-Ala carboxypeptidase
MKMSERLSPHLTLEEFTRSDTATRLGIDNSLPENLLEAAIQTGVMLERIRKVLGTPMLISSGYRCPELNKAIGSGTASDHTKAEALDFKAPRFGSPLAICQALLPHMQQLGIGQMIYEHSWVHISTRTPNNVGNVALTLSGRGYVTGIVH